MLGWNLRGRRILARALSVLAVASLTGTAAAQAPAGSPPTTDASAENVAAARALGAQGVTLAIEGKCQEAIDPLSRAEQLYHAPTIQTELGYCLCEVGRLVEGTEHLNRVVREPLGENPPQAFVNAQARARTLLDAYLPRLGNLVIQVQAPAGVEYQVAVDGRPVSAALLGAARPTDPGERVVTAGGAGLRSTEARVTLAQGGQAQVTLVLEALAPTPETEAPPIAEPVEKKPNLVPAYVAFGVGAVGLGVGGIFGASAMSTKSDLESRCRNGDCPTGSQGDIDSMNRSANIATVGFAVGLVGVGAGLYFLLTAEDSGTSKAASGCEGSPCLTPVIGLGQLGMEGTF